MIQTEDESIILDKPCGLGVSRDLLCEPVYALVQDTAHHCAACFKVISAGVMALMRNKPAYEQQPGSTSRWFFCGDDCCREHENFLLEKYGFYELPELITAAPVKQLPAEEEEAAEGCPAFDGDGAAKR